MSRSRKALSGFAAGGLAATALIVALIVSVSGSVPAAAQAFPALNNPSAPTPAALQQSLNYYGAAPNSLDIATGHTIHTPWGTGYVMTGTDDRFVCVVAPGPNRADWGASCAQTKQAATNGTIRYEYAYNAATRTARLIALLPKNATVTMQTRGGKEHRIGLPDGLLATQISGPATIRVTINDHTTVDHVVPRDSMTVPVTTTASQSGASTVAATTVTTAP